MPATKNEAQTETAEKKPAAYLTVNVQPKEGKPFVQNFFLRQGKDGEPILDSKGHMIFDNSQRGLTALISQSGKLCVKNEEKETVKNFKLTDIVSGFREGLASKGLEAGKATISGPAELAEKIASHFESVIKKAALEKSKSPSP